MIKYCTNKSHCEEDRLRNIATVRANYNHTCHTPKLMLISGATWSPTVTHRLQDPQVKF